MPSLVERLTELPDFDLAAMIEAMSSVEHRVFVVWKKGGE